MAVKLGFVTLRGKNGVMVSENRELGRLSKMNTEK
jgi:hypothetical protein